MGVPGKQQRKRALAFKIAHCFVPPTTIAAFIAAQADTAEFELVERVIVMMTNPAETHEEIAVNICVC